MTEELMDAHEKWEDAVGHSLKVIAEGSLKSDRALLELIQTAINRLVELEAKVDMLMELHKLDK